MNAPPREKKEPFYSIYPQPGLPKKIPSNQFAYSCICKIDRQQQKCNCQHFQHLLQFYTDCFSFMLHYAEFIMHKIENVKNTSLSHTFTALFFFFSSLAVQSSYEGAGHDLTRQAKRPLNLKGIAVHSTVGTVRNPTRKINSQ